ncbi:ABC transporter ATP-binding protein [Marinicella meishanensis]|uniref:ABC transporter ATP-binding protein n=1 Tax=Marinicella meishanensis TaxID=2873263 RepID=UPI001CC11631|nr:ABC transporter ATP-binding protein [Marinicella sp. NBU2979]
MLTIEGLHLHQDNLTVFKDLNAAFKPGEFWAVVGQNGVGKTTLLQTMAGISQPRQGRVQVAGHNLFELDIAARAQQVSFLLQDQEPCLAFSVRDAVGMGRFPWRSKKQQDQAITTAALETCGISHLADRSILKLSGGERRKVEIATCLAQQSDFLLLDEPLNHLDVVYRQQILKVFAEYSQQRCVVMVCHDLEVIKHHCSHVLMLMANDCYLAGTSATILNQTNLDQLFDARSE